MMQLSSYHYAQSKSLLMNVSHTECLYFHHFCSTFYKKKLNIITTQEGFLHVFAEKLACFVTFEIFFAL